MAEESEDRTQAATERRRQQARDDGQAPLSRELVVASGLAAATLVLALGAPALAAALGARLQRLLSDLGATPGDALHDAGMALLVATLPFLGAVLLAGSGAVLLQTGWLLHGQTLVPDLSRLDPRRGLRRLFGLDNAVEAAKSLAKVSVLAWAAWHALSDALPGVLAASTRQPGALLDQLARDVLHLFLLVLGCQAGIALLDAGWVHFRFSRRLRMSRQEIKHEQRETDGDPRHKSRLRQLRMARARQRMLAAVPRATVVITNPTHYAVALAYDRGAQAAPRVVAKGVDEVAARIRKAAAEHGVPLVANPPLARALHQLALDAEVPAEHFKAVAEIIAYVWRLRGQTPAR